MKGEQAAVITQCPYFNQLNPLAMRLAKCGTAITTVCHNQASLKALNKDNNLRLTKIR